MICPHAAKHLASRHCENYHLGLRWLGSSEELDFIAIVCASHDTLHDARRCEKAFLRSVTDSVSIMELYNESPNKGNKGYLIKEIFWPFRISQDDTDSFKRPLY